MRAGRRDGANGACRGASEGQTYSRSAKGRDVEATGVADMGVRNWLSAAAVTVIVTSGLAVMPPSASAATRLGGIDLGAY